MIIETLKLNRQRFILTDEKIPQEDTDDEEIDKKGSPNVRHYTHH